jgi:peptidoglycan/LPS O-acetylase OafA/YrhL
MTKQLSLYLYGSLIIIAGLLLFILQSEPLRVIQYTTAGCILLAAIFAFITALKRNGKQVQFAYHEIHGLALLGYFVALFFFCHNVERFTYITAHFFVFYAFSEIIFAIWLFNLKKQISSKILILRLVLAFFIGISTMAILNYSEANPITNLICIGGIFVIIGVNILLYQPIMQTLGQEI